MVSGFFGEVVTWGMEYCVACEQTGSEEMGDRGLVLLR